jgi:ATP-dependent RNA helicase DDX51/DBP6
LSPSLAPLIGTLTSTTKTTDRRKTIQAFTTRRLRILVASDLVSRGIDLPLLDHVINYDLPPTVEGYVHRIGRTARAGHAGKAWTLLPDSESGWFWGKIAKGLAIGRSAEVGRVRIGAAEGDPFDQKMVQEYTIALRELGDEAGEARRRGRR